MNDLMSRLSDLGSETAAPSEETVAADVRRGRRALRRRRVVRGATGGALGLALAGTGIAIGVHGAGSTPATGGGVRLVDYTGTQPAGFTVATVPAGWVVQGAGPGSLDIARPGDTTDLGSFTGKIVVYLQEYGRKPDTSGTRLSVDGRPAYLHEPGDGGEMLEWVDAQGHDVILQSWKDLGLTDDQLVQIADGVTVTSAAVKPATPDQNAPEGRHYALYRTPRGDVVRIPLKGDKLPRVLHYRNAQGKRVSVPLGTRGRSARN